ncbi:hypothetical protein ACYZX9_06265 [Sphingomonas citri]
MARGKVYAHHALIVTGVGALFGAASMSVWQMLSLAFTLGHRAAGG